MISFLGELWVRTMGWFFFFLLVTWGAVMPAFWISVALSFMGMAMADE